MQIKTLHQVFLRHNPLIAKRPSIWFLHGFADSGLAYREVFASPLAQDFNLYVVDLPGFGASPLQPAYASIKSQADLLTQIIQEECAESARISIVAHSIGALIGTWLCQTLADRIHYYFNIEGNLTEADSYFSSKPLQFESVEAFMASFEREIFAQAQKEERYRRYYSSLRFADPQALHNWSESSQVHIQGNRCGHAFRELMCQKLYIWGDKDTPQETQAFIQRYKIPNRLYQGVGHWHMVENGRQVYADIHSILTL